MGPILCQTKWVILFHPKSTVLCLTQTKTLFYVTLKWEYSLSISKHLIFARKSDDNDGDGDGDDDGNGDDDDDDDDDDNDDDDDDDDDDVSFT